MTADSAAAAPAIGADSVYRDMKILGVRDSIKAVVHHYKQGNLNWPMVIYIGLAHVAAVVGIFTLPFCSWQTLLLAFVLWPIT